MIALVGMPGSGKSTVGRQLSRHIGWPFIDTDVEIEQRLGESIRAYFEKYGEPAFRDVESEVLSSLALQPELILATGGGTVLREANREVLRRSAKVVYLRATPDDLYRRLRHDRQRPLLQGGDPLAKLNALFAERDPLYRQVADFTIDTGRSSVPALVQFLMSQLELAGVIPAAQPPSEP